MIARYRFSYSSFRYSVHLYKLPPTDRRSYDTLGAKGSLPWSPVQNTVQLRRVNTSCTRMLLVTFALTYDTVCWMNLPSSLLTSERLPVDSPVQLNCGTVERWSRSRERNRCRYLGEGSEHSTWSTCQPSDVRPQVAIAELSTVETPPSTTSCYSVAATFHWRLISVSSVFLP